MQGLQPAGRLRGVLVEGGADEASLRLGNVRWVLGLHPGRQTLSALAERGRRPLGPGQSLTGTRFPSSAAPPDSKRHARTREECPGLALSDDTHRAPSEQSVGLLDGLCEKNPNSENLIFFLGGQRCYYVVNFQGPHSKTKTADGRCVTPRRVAIGCPRRVDPSFPAFLLVEWHQACDSFDNSDLDSVRTAYHDGRAVDWPMALSVSSRGNVFMFSLAFQRERAG